VIGVPGVKLGLPPEFVLVVAPDDGDIGLVPVSG
jgi:hypothetical protein